jgi:hypothetical protein
MAVSYSAVSVDQSDSRKVFDFDEVLLVRTNSDTDSSKVVAIFSYEFGNLAAEVASVLNGA